MRIRSKLGLFALTIVALSSPVTAQLSKEEVIEPSAKQIVALQRLTPESVAALVLITNDELETVATLDTSRAYTSRGGFTDRVRSDNFVRALIDKSDGKIVYQVYQYVSYLGDARNFTSVNFATDRGPIKVPVQNISIAPVTCSQGFCDHDDVVGFIVPEAVLRSIAAKYVAGASIPWRFRFKAQNGVDWEDRLMPAEVAGLLIAVDRFKTAKSR